MMTDSHSDRLPWLKLWVADLLADARLQFCSLAARGFWLMLLARMHTSSPRGYLQHADGSALQVAELARLVGASLREAKVALAELDRAGALERTEGGVIFSSRMLADEHKRQKCAEAGKRGGGNPGARDDSGQFTKGEAKGGTEGEARGDAEETFGPDNTENTEHTESREQEADPEPDPEPDAEPGSRAKTARSLGDSRVAKKPRRAGVWLDHFVSAYEIAHFYILRRPYVGDRGRDRRHLKAFGEAGLRDELEVGLAEWVRVALSYARTDQSKHTIADLCGRFAEFQTGRRDRFDRRAEADEEQIAETVEDAQGAIVAAVQTGKVEEVKAIIAAQERGKAANRDARPAAASP